MNNLHIVCLVVVISAVACAVLVETSKTTDLSPQENCVLTGGSIMVVDDGTEWCLMPYGQQHVPVVGVVIPEEIQAGPVIVDPCPDYCELLGHDRGWRLNDINSTCWCCTDIELPEQCEPETCRLVDGKEECDLVPHCWVEEMERCEFFEMTTISAVAYSGALA